MIYMFGKMFQNACFFKILQKLSRFRVFVCLRVVVLDISTIDFSDHLLKVAHAPRTKVFNDTFHVSQEVPNGSFSRLEAGRIHPTLEKGDDVQIDASIESFPRSRCERHTICI